MKTFLAALCALLFAAVPAAADDVISHLRSAEDHAIRGEIGRARSLYEALLDEGVDSAELRYNLGTLHLLEGDVGQAVRHLRTALRYDPSLDDASHNLQVALSLRQDRIVDERARPPLPDRLAALLAPRTAELGFLLSLAALSLVFGLLAWAPARTLQRALMFALLPIGALLVALALVLGGAVLVHAREEAVVLVSEVKARVAPKDDAAEAFEAHAGLFGEVVARENGYARLRLPNGLDAWIPEDALGLVGER